MFFEALETRRMFAVTLAVKTVVPPPQFPASIAPPPQLTAGSAAKSGQQSAVTSAAQATVDPSRLANLGNVTLLDGVSVALNPADRSGAGDLSAGGLRDLLGALFGDGFLQNFAGRSISTDVIASAQDGANARSLFDVVGADLASMRGIYESARGDRTSQSSVNLGVDLTSEEIANAKAGNTNNSSGETKTEEKGLLDKIIDFFTGGDEKKDEKKTEGDYVVDYFTSPDGYALDLAGGPVPAPVTTALNGPGYVEKVTGDSKDLVNGFIAILKSGQRDANSPEYRTPDPNSDTVALSPQQQNAINQILALSAKYLANGPRLADQGKGLISQPSDDAIVRSKPDREQLPAERIFASKLAPYINPGSGDDGNTVTIGDASGAPLGPKAIVKDPPKPDMVGTLPGTSGTPRQLPAGGAPSSPGGTTPDQPGK